MTSALLVAGDPAAGPWLRGAAAGDQERLRVWRNAAAGAFFQPARIDAEAQRRWFEGYLGREEDFLFMVMEAAEPRGCLGVRLADGEWDVYNVIRGERTAGSRGAMGRGLDLLVDFARRRAALPVRAVVLAGNPAIGWYERQGFAVVRRQPGSVVMRWTGTSALPAEGA